MIKKLQKLKAKKGFTLVELIVVIAIIGVLAAILVPTMLGYVQNSRVTAVDQVAKTIKDAAQVSATEMDTLGNGLQATTLTVYGDYKPASAAGSRVTIGSGAGTAATIGADTNYKGMTTTGAASKHGAKLAASLETLLTEQSKNLSFCIVYNNGTAVQVYASEDLSLTSTSWAIPSGSTTVASSAWTGGAGIASGGAIVGSNPKYNG